MLGCLNPNSISTTVVEVKKNIHDSYNGLMTANVKANHMTLNFMSRCHNKYILNNVIFALKMPLLSERHLMTVVINIHKPHFIFKTYVMS